ncbi:DUF5994 family protein [Mycobacteroides abscessus]|uniref:DUF5994 family protein n=1 Tax=Mycobacteroides abscessus TaxID=36809 RepID=UPI001AFC99F0|nr:hypothetical protein PROPHIGD15-1_113 [Mycobacterium phage prophiGD15-1]
MAHQIFCPQPLQSALRLHLDPKTGYADGAWCPRSKDLSVEVLPLLTRLSLDLGPIDRITYRAGEWAPSSRRVLFLNRLVHLGWSLLQPASTISVRGTNGAHLTLLIVPPSRKSHSEAEDQCDFGGRSDRVPKSQSAGPTTS